MSVLSPSPVLKWALSHGADPNLNLIGESRTPLELSVSKDSMEHAEALIAAGAHINNTNALKIAACHGYTKMIELLLEKGADINEIPRPDYLDLNPEQGLGTALHEAAAEDPTLQNTAGKTALELAQEQHHSEIVDVLEGRKCK
ncbi:Ankyrin repeat domain-containing protein 50 [Termitomyces sp. J132]|nr:Ankyrin repeat domain-containing protein 50 [Termitomyces sp. J132]